MKVKFYLTSSGRNPVEEFLLTLSKEMRAEFLDAIHLLSTGQLLKMPLSRSLAGIHHGLHELRLKDRYGHVRVFYFMKKEDANYILHAFKKKQQDLPKKEIDVALKRIKGVS